MFFHPDLLALFGQNNSQASCFPLLSWIIFLSNAVDMQLI